MDITNSCYHYQITSLGKDRLSLQALKFRQCDAINGEYVQQVTQNFCGTDLRKFLCSQMSCIPPLGFTISTH